MKNKKRDPAKVVQIKGIFIMEVFTKDFLKYGV